MLNRVLIFVCVCAEKTVIPNTKKEEYALLELAEPKTSIFSLFLMTYRICFKAFKPNWDNGLYICAAKVLKFTRLLFCYNH